MYRNYITLNARIRCLENKLLKKQDYEKINSSDISYFLSLIKTLNYGKYMDKFSIEEVIENGFKEDVEFILRMIPEIHTEIFMIFKYEYDIYNFSFMLNDLKEFSNLGSLKKDEIQKYITQNTLIQSPLKLIFDEIKEKGSENIEQIKLIFFLKIIEKFKNNFIINFFKMLIDLTNIRNFIREKLIGIKSFKYIPLGNLPIDFFTDYETLQKKIKLSNYKNLKLQENGNSDVFEISLNEYIKNYISLANYSFFGPEVAFAYLIKKKDEMENLKKIYKLKLTA